MPSHAFFLAKGLSISCFIVTRSKSSGVLVPSAPLFRSLVMATRSKILGRGRHGKFPAHRSQGSRHVLRARSLPAREAASLRSVRPRPALPRPAPRRPRVTFPFPASPGSGAAAMRTSWRLQSRPGPAEGHRERKPHQPRAAPPRPRAQAAILGNVFCSPVAAPARAVSFVH